MKTFKLTPAQNEFLSRGIKGFNKKDWTVKLAAEAGSDRRFVRIKSRLSSGSSYMMIVWNAEDPDWPRFMSIAKEVSFTHSLLPEIRLVEPVHGLILEEDMGNIRLKDTVIGRKTPRYLEKQYMRVIDALLLWHGHSVLPGTSIATRRMDEEMFLWESDYFAKHCATEYFGLEKLLDRQWEDERRLMAHTAASLKRVCMHRDFQSENVMIHNGRIRFVDFQGARLGPAEYDLAALIYDPYVPNLTPEISEHLFNYYAQKSGHGITRNGFLLSASQRLLQALGAFANLSLHKGKDWYREFIPTGLERLALALKETHQFPAMLNTVLACKQAVERRL